LANEEIPEVPDEFPDLPQEYPILPETIEPEPSNSPEPDLE